MSAFDYPRVLHTRKHGPSGYATYSAYRPWLRDEFTFRCVYCLAREHWGRVLGEFGVDHFRPQAKSPDQALDIRNRQLIEKTAPACKLTLSGFLTDDDLELYYDVARGREELGDISKGWDDPGFRIGNLVQIAKGQSARLKSMIARIRKLCATNGIGLTIERTTDSIDIR